MFLHLISDEKFIDGAIERFEKNDPGNHEFVFFSLKEPATLRHVRLTESIKSLCLYSKEYDDLLSGLSHYAAVFVHGFINKHFVEFVNAADQNTVFVWLFWGAEIWALKRFRTKAYLPLTRALYYKHQFNIQVHKLKINLRKYTRLVSLRDRISAIGAVGSRSGRINRLTDADVQRAIARVDYVIPVIPDDYDVLKKLLPCPAELLDWNYSPGLPLKELDKLSINGRDILIGNSAHYTNNHWDVFVKIKKHDNLFEKLIVPLSYGNPVYQQTVLKIGRRMWGNQFYPLLEFLPALEYFSQISTCYAAIFNSIRQQAMGNIIVSLYLGSKVFLRRENPIYRYLKKQDAIIYSIEDDLNARFLKDSLLEEKREINRRIIRNLYNEENLDKKTRQLIRYLNEQSEKRKKT